MNNNLRKFYVTLIIGCVPFTKSYAIAEERASDVNEKQNDIGDDTNENDLPYTKEDEDLEKIKNDLAFDPIQKKWLPIKDMTGIQHKDKKEKNDGNETLYEEAMIYNKKTNKWQKKSITDNLYEELNTPEKQPKTFWQNFSVGLTLGGGATFYRNNLNNISILDHKEKIYFQSQTQKDKGEATLVNWFHDEYLLNNSFDNTESKILAEIDNDRNIYTGRGWSIPFTIFMDYTFCESWRVGFAFVIEAGILEKLVPSDSISSKVNAMTGLSKDSLFIWNVRPLVTFGYKVYTTENSDWLATFQLGPVYDKGIGSKQKNGGHRENILFSDYKRMGLFAGIGIGYELALNGYCTLVNKLSYDFKYYNDNTTAKGVKIFDETEAYVSLWQQTIKLEIGMRFTFAENNRD